MSKFKLDKVRDNMEQVKRDLPIVIANKAVTYFTYTFAVQGIGGDKWQQVKRRIPDTPEYKYPKRKGLSRRTKPILIGTGRLRRAVAASKQLTTFNLIKLVVDLPYAARHNDGLDNMPKRSFMKSTPQLEQKIRSAIHSYIDKAFEV